MSIKKIKSGEATFISEQSFLTEEDDYNDKHPTSEETITVQEIKIDKTWIKKEVKKNVLGQ